MKSIFYINHWIIMPTNVVSIRGTPVALWTAWLMGNTTCTVLPALCPVWDATLPRSPPSSPVSPPTSTGWTLSVLRNVHFNYLDWNKLYKNSEMLEWVSWYSSCIWFVTVICFFSLPDHEVNKRFSRVAARKDSARTKLLCVLIRLHSFDKK